MEMPEDVVEEVRVKGAGTRPSRPVSSASRSTQAAEVDGTEFKLGQRVLHAKFGEGVVLNYEGEGKQARVQVNFKEEGSKWLMLAYARLERLS